MLFDPSRCGDNISDSAELTSGVVHISSNAGCSMDFSGLLNRIVCVSVFDADASSASSRDFMITLSRSPVTISLDCASSVSINTGPGLVTSPKNFLADSEISPLFLSDDEALLDWDITSSSPPEVRKFPSLIILAMYASALFEYSPSLKLGSSIFIPSISSFLKAARSFGLL